MITGWIICETHTNSPVVPPLPMQQIFNPMDIRDTTHLKQKLECNDFKLEADHDLIEKLHADKRELQEKIDTLTEDLQDYKRLLKENGFDVEEEEVAMEE
jgi:hypothetical protein